MERTGDEVKDLDGIVITPERQHILDVRMAIAILEHLYESGLIAKKTFEKSLSEAKKMIE